MIDILIPVLGRPHNVKPLLASLRVTKTPYRAVFICSPGDTAQIEECEASGVETWTVAWPAGSGDFAKKINWAFPKTDNEWIFQGADDIRFREDWDRQALRVAERTGALVIGTNDLHNPQVKRRISSTHTLFARRYITEQGGTVDGNGLVFHEGYDHNFVDVEFCTTARRRGVWASAPQSIVEHLHPHWGLADRDATYLKGERHTARDHRLYNRRMGIHDAGLTLAQRNRARRG